MPNFILRLGVGLAALSTAACTTPTVGNTRTPTAYQDTRLQFAILTDDRDTLRKQFRVNPDRSGLERGLTAFTLPFAATTETLFYPAFYWISSSASEESRD